MTHTHPANSIWPAILIWLLTATSLFMLDGLWSLGNLGLLLVLGGTLAGIWLTPSVCVVISAIAVTGFNWFFVAPRYTFHVALNQDLFLLITLLCTSSIISWLTSRLRQHTTRQTEKTRHTQQLNQLGTELQKASTVTDQLACACQLIQDWSELPVSVWLNDTSPTPDDPLYRAWRASQQEQGAIGPGTGRHETIQALVLPLRAGVQRIGTIALGPIPDYTREMSWPMVHIQSIARMLAYELHRLQSSLLTREAQDNLHTQKLRNTLLAAISHDYRTPLATITGAASGLLQFKNPDQNSINSAVHTILQESEHLLRMTNNTLQMARLDSPNAAPNSSWESVEELCGVVLSAARRRHPERYIETQVPAGLPLLHCDPILVIQLLDNLMENALCYSEANQPVKLSVHLQGKALQIDVLDRGIGIAPLWRERVFEPFQRVPPETSNRRGMGLGLALCQTIAQIHNARLWIEDHQGGGTKICLRFAIQEQPTITPEDNS